MKKPVLLIAGAVAVALAAAKRRHTQADAAQLWREATSDASR